MSDVWLTIAGLAVATFAIKGTGPLLLGGRELPPRALEAIALLAPALLAALVVTETLGGEDKSLVLDARAVGVGAAAVALALRASLLIAVVVAAGAAALARGLA